jgi:uncharacterized protein
MTTPFHIMTKPIGPICNLGCKYCFYLEKESLYPSARKWAMSPEVLESFIRQYIESQQTPEVNFAWQGGEPTLLGVEFFERVVELQQRYAGGRRVSNALQTNGTLLDDRWCEFLARHQFLIGLSIDGPRRLHDAWRVDKQDRPTFDAVMRGAELLKRHKVEFNTLTVVNRTNSQHPLEVYQFLKQMGSQFLQFIPLVERLGNAPGELSPPPQLTVVEANQVAAPWAVEPRQYGQFLIDIFDYWVRHDVGRVFVQLFDVSLGIWSGHGAGLCVFAEECGRAMALEHNGDLYSCDHYVYPNYKLGNLLNQSAVAMGDGVQQVQFGKDKSERLPQYCRRCEVRFACNGECPKHRFLTTPDGEPGLNYLCEGYRHFFRHIDGPMKTMASLLQARRAPAEIMAILAREKSQGGAPAPGTAGATGAAGAAPGRNDACPCGSGRKYKKCCGASR